MSTATLERRSPDYYSVPSDHHASELEVRIRPVSLACVGAMAASLAAAPITTSDKPSVAKADTAVSGPTNETFSIADASLLVSNRKQGPTDALVQRVRELGAYATGWHSENSQSASRRTVEEAERFIRAINWNEHILPVIALAEDGEMNLVWSDTDRHVDIGFFGDGTYAYYARGRDGRTYFEDGAPWHQTLPQDIVSLIAKEREA